MKHWNYKTGDPVHRSLTFLVLRFAVFLLMAWTIFASVESGSFLPLWLALGYFALSEILLVVRAGRWIQQGVAIGIYFLDVFAVTSLIQMKGLSIQWYLTIPVLMLGATLCYNRRWAWLPVALIPSVLVLYEMFYTTAVSREWIWQLIGMVFLFFVFGGVVYLLVREMDRMLSLYQGQRRLVQCLPGISPAATIRDCMQKILEKDPPLDIYFFSILLFDEDGNLRGLERDHVGKVGEVLLGQQRIPSSLRSIQTLEVFQPDIRKEKNEKAFFEARKLSSLLGSRIRIGEMDGMVLFGRKGRNAFSAGEREIFSTYAEIMTGWMRQSHAFEKEGNKDQEPDEHPVEKAVQVLETAVGKEGEAAASERLQVLEKENRQLKEALDEQLRTATLELNKTVLSLMAREAETDQKVFERLASLDLSQAISMLFDLDLVLDLIVEMICEKISVKTVSIMLLREDKGDLVVKAHRGLQDDIAQNTRLMVGEAIAGYVAQKGEPLLIEDIEKDPRFVPFRRDRYRSGTLLSVPVLHEGKVLGVINLSDPVREGPFTDRDLEILMALSRQAAIAIVSQRLYRDFENGQWIREFYEEGLSQRLSEKVFQKSPVLEKVEGEYRVTVLSVHLHENEILRHNPDSAARIRSIEQYLQEIREVIARHRGDVAGEAGIGIMGVFGLPFPDHGDPWRAVLAAADLLKVFSRFSQDMSPENVRGIGVSVGVATGELLIREKKGSVPYAVFGQTWERALTLMQAGSPGQILVDEETFEKISSRVHSLRLVLSYGIHKKLTAYGIKGLKRPVPGE
ncbi:MAG: GAF domain-containing protein [bacterium]